MTSHLINKETQVQEFKLLAQIYIIHKLQNQNLNTVLSIYNVMVKTFRFWSLSMNTRSAFFEYFAFLMVGKLFKFFVLVS